MERTIEVWLKDTSQPIVHTAINTYQKGSLYCVYATNEKVYKYPFSNIWRIVEDYGKHSGQEKI